MVSDGDLHCTMLTVFVGFSGSFSGFLSFSFALFSLSAASSFSFFVERSYIWTGDSCEDWLCDRLLLPPSGVRRSSCSEDMRNLFKLNLRTSEWDFFFFFFRLAFENASVVNCSSFSSSSRCDCCWDTSEAEENCVRKNSCSIALEYERNERVSFQFYN